MNIEPEQIKKLRVRYLKCSKGDLHQGEVLNFICIDPNCRNKGLICPVCQNTQHEGHQTLHLKLFLAEINRTLYNKEESTELSGLAEYLRSLDTSKREMIKSLKDMVEQLATKVRQVEEKIDTGYCLLRKIILSQSTVSMRLPELYRLLTEEDCTQNEEDILKQISRYSQLLEFKNNKLITVDSAKNLVVQYASKAGSLAAHLTTVVSEVTKIFNNLPLDVNKFGKKQEKTETKENLTFSTTHKSINVTDEKSVKLTEGSFSGIAFTTNDENNTVKKASFKISEATEGELILIGVANPNQYSSRNYEINLEGESKLFGLCSIGFLPEELEGDAFMYSAGDTIDVTWTPAEGKLVFSRRHSIEKCQTHVPLTDDGSKLTFFVALSSPATKVQIVQ